MQELPETMRPNPIGYPKPNNICSWDDLIAFLSNDIAWTSPQRMKTEIEAAAEALRLLARFPDEIRRRMTEIAEDADTLRRYSPEVRMHRVFFDKLLLYVDPERRFVVRFHRFRPTLLSDAGDPIHAHEWPLATVILRGAYDEHLYDIEDLKIAPGAVEGTGRAVPRGVRRILQGQSNTLPPELAHAVVNQDARSVFTLMVRGKSEERGHLNFEPDTGLVYRTSRDPLFNLRRTLLSMRAFEDYPY